MARARYSAGTIMLQVAPSLKGFHEEIRRQAKGSAKAFEDEFQKEQAKASRRTAQSKAAEDAEERAARRSAERAEKEAARRLLADSKADRGARRLLEARIADEKKARDSADRAADEGARQILTKRMAEEKKAADARIASDKRVADARIAADKRADEGARQILTKRMAEEKKAADSRIAADNKAAAAKTAADERIAANAAKAAEREERVRVRAAEREAAAVARAQTRAAKDREKFAKGQNVVGGTSSLSVAQLGATDAKKYAATARAALASENLELDVNLSGEGHVTAEYNSIVAQMKALGDVKIGVDMTMAEFNAKYANLEARLIRLSRQDVDIDVRLQATKALLEMGAVTAGIKGMEAANRSNSVATRDAGQEVGGAANSFRAMNGALLAAVTIGPALIPIMASLAGVLVGVAAGAVAVGVGIGGMVLGLSGIGTAVSALGDRSKAVRRQAAQGPKAPSQSSISGAASRARTIRDAAQNVVDARADAPKIVDRALRAQESAERALASAQQTALRAQQRLNEARREATRDIEDLAFAIRKGQLDEQMSTYTLQAAAIQYNVVLEDDQATDREKDVARIQYEQAQLAAEELRVSNQRLAVEQAESDANGVEGSSKVLSAKESIIDADQSLIDSERSLAEARNGVAEAHISAARKISDAEQRLADALEANALASMGAAASAQAFDSSLFDLQEAMDGLSPAGQRFAEFLHGLKPFLDELKFGIQETFLPGLQSGIQLLVDTYGPRLEEFMGTLGTALGEMSLGIAEWLTSPAMQSFFDTMAVYTPIWLDIFTRILTGLSGGILSTFEALAPFATTFGEALADLAEGFAAWASSDAGREAIQAFSDYLSTVGPDVWAAFVALAGALVSLFEALAPFGGTVLDVLTGLFLWISDMDPELLSTLVRGIFALVFAFQAFFTLMALAGTIAVAFSAGWIGVIIAAVALLVAALIYFWPEISAFFAGVGQWFTDLYNNYIKPVFDLIAAAATWLWENGIKPAFEGIAAVVSWVWDNILLPIFEAFQSVLGFVAAAAAIWWNLMVIAFNGVAGVVSWIWNTIWKPAFNAMADIFSFFWENGVKPIWENYLKPMFDLLGSVIEDTVVPAFQRGIDALATIWEGLKALVAKPVKFVIDTIINEGIIDNFNTFAGNFPGTIEVPHVPVPGWMANYATGTSNAVLPGYTPGRDVHRFVSPTGGILNLSGGEAILRPEVTKALGRHWIDDANSAAMSGGVGAVRRRVQGFATGGVVDFGGGSSVPESSFFLGGVWDGIKNLAGGAADAIRSVTGAVAEFIRDPGAVLQRVVDGLMSTFSGSDTTFMKMVAGVPKKAIDDAANYVKSIFTPDAFEAAKTERIGDALTAGMSGDGSATTTGGWANPSVGPVTSRYGKRNLLGGTWHAGVDIAGGGNTFAAAGGHVHRVGWNIVPGRSGYGIALQHAPSMFTYYGHNPVSGVVVSQGQTVAAGQRIGRQGSTGNVTGEHLHYEVHVGGYGRDTDPTPFMAARGITLGRNAPKPAQTMLYDDGGYLLPGVTNILNATGRPEQIFTHEQAEMLKQASGLNGGSSTGGRGALDGANFYSYDPKDIVDRYRTERSKELAMAGLSEIEVMLP